MDKIASIRKAIEYAEIKVGELSSRDIFMLGLAIYIGEGTKTFSFTRIANADPRIIRFSMLWFRESFGLTNQNFRIRIHMYPDNNEDEVINFWMNELGLDRKYFQSSSIDRREHKISKKKNILPFGTAHLSVVSNGDKNFGVLLHRKILASIDRVLKNTNAGLV